MSNFRVNVRGYKKLRTKFVVFRQRIKQDIYENKLRATSQALQAVSDLVPVWSGQTQDSVLVSQGARVSRRPDRRPGIYTTFSGASTNSVDPGRADERMANLRRYQPMVSTVTLAGVYKDIWITSDSIAGDAGVWVGLAPTPAKARAPLGTLTKILARAQRGTIFKP